MGIIKYKNRIEQFDYLIRHKISGTPGQCAKKLGLSRSCFYTFVEDLKLIGIPIIYNQEKKRYEYQFVGKVIIGFISNDKLTSVQLFKVKGGIKNRMLSNRKAKYEMGYEYYEQ